MAVDQASTFTAPTLTLNGGSANLFTLSTTGSIGFGGTAGGALTVHAISGSHTVTGLSYGDRIDFANTTAVTLSNNAISALGGTLTLSAPANASYRLYGDGAGGIFVTLIPQTIGIDRFFDTTNGTHFYTTDPAEAANILATRPDL